MNKIYRVGERCIRRQIDYSRLVVADTPEGALATYRLHERRPALSEEQFHIELVEANPLFQPPSF